jgi:pyruvate/2-oxoglutarate dehydrogenase complex dihydrolipoamide dehydrogenase (E3) component
VVVGDALLVAIGRVPHVEGLGLEAAGVEYDTNQGVKVRMLVKSKIKVAPYSTDYRDD